MIDFYRDELGLNFVKIDPTNNSEPKRLLKQMVADYPVNYQVSHVFGRTKNIYAFGASWNIVLLPKFIDPFSGHESQGVIKDEFTYRLQRMIFDKYRRLISEYNSEILKLDIQNKANHFIASIKTDNWSPEEVDRFRKSLAAELSIISV